MLVVPIVLIVVAIVVVIGAMIGVRRADEVAAEWHADPLTTAKPETPNSHRVAPLSAAASIDAEAPIYPVPVDQLAAAFDAVATGDERVDVLAGSAASGFVTYVQRSALFGFPDYVSVRFLEAAGGSTLAVFSRSRFGRNDLGVNEKRVTRWLDGTASRLG